MSTIDQHGNIHGEDGQFTGHVKGEADPDTVLSANQALDDEAALADRLRILRSSQRYVPARPMGAADVDDPDEFWARQYETAEYAPPQVAYPKMPDDFTPGRTEGRALSGLRRTHRARYEGSQVDLLMPSATSVRAYANTVDGAFDIPVQATDKQGNQVTAWVRCSRTPNGRWITSGLGFGGDDDAIVSESVAAVLEARRPRQALKQVGDLIAAHRERVASTGIGITPVHSSWIKGFGYSAEDGMTVMETLPSETKKGEKRPGKLYGYRTGPGEYMRAANAASPGRAFSELLKGRPRVELGVCPRCGRVYAITHTHTCRSVHRRPEGEYNHTLQRWAAVDGARDLIREMNDRNRRIATSA